MRRRIARRRGRSGGLEGGGKEACCKIRLQGRRQGRCRQTRRKDREARRHARRRRESRTARNHDAELATLVDGPPERPEEWIYEIKFDGYRILARVDQKGKDIRLITRNGNDWTDKLRPLHDEIKRMKLPDGWYDGEIVVHDENGKPNFNLLQLAFDGSNRAQIVYFIFDAPYMKGWDLRDVRLDQRRPLLQEALEARPSDTVRFSAEFAPTPASWW